MPFNSVDDVVDIEAGSLNAKKVDIVMHGLIDSYALALKHQASLYKESVTLLRNQLFLFATTHNSVRLVLRRAFRKREYPLVADASSLAREQVEKLFIIALLLDDPKKWTRQYRRSSWRKDYEEFLLENGEQRNNPRFQQHLDKNWPDYLEKTRRFTTPSGGNFEVLVSSLAKRLIKYNFENPSGPKPKWLRRKGSVREYLRDYFDFPTPRKAASRIGDLDLRGFLVRWHKEYQYLCTYSHVALGKMVLQFMSEFKNVESTQMLRTSARRQADRALFLSYTAGASACALISTILSNRYGEKHNLRSFWETLSKSSLLSRTLWNLYVRNLLA